MFNSHVVKCLIHVHVIIAYTKVSQQHRQTKQDIISFDSWL